MREADYNVGNLPVCHRVVGGCERRFAELLSEQKLRDVVPSN
jgi:hypothetical protein